MLDKEKKLVMCGCHFAGYKIIESLLEEGIQFEYFVTLSEEQAQKFNVSEYKNFESLAKQYNIPVYYPIDYSLKNNEDYNFFNKHKFDLLIQGGWQRLFPKNVLDTLNIGAIGGHGSSDFLPKGRGRSPLNWSLIEGKKRFIMHLFFIKPGVDDGDIIDTEMFDINDFDDIRTLYMKNVIVTKRMLIRSLPKIIDGTISVKKQDGIPSYYKKRSPADGLINWENMDVWQIYNFVRAQTRPYPGAYGYINEKCIKIWRCQVFDTRINYSDAKYGECVESFDNNLIINCRGGLLLIEDYEIM
ncbi:MAG: formyltransferase family protein [Methanoregula sp.]|nr:formyltransferase family protein [Methanoregula sp.]